MDEFPCNTRKNTATYKAPSKVALGVLGFVTPRLHPLPPVLEFVQAVAPRKLFQQFHGNDGADSGEALDVIATEKVCELHEFLAVDTELARKVGEEEALDSLGLVEHVLVHPRPAEKEHVRVVRDDALDEAELDKRRALRFRLHWRRDVRDTEQAEHHLRSSEYSGDNRHASRDLTMIWAIIC